MKKEVKWWALRASFIHKHMDREETFIVQGNGRDLDVVERVGRIIQKKYPKVTAWGLVGGVHRHYPGTGTKEEISQIVDTTFDGKRV
jgi:hypothetical protein